MFYVYRRHNSDGARVLAQALGGSRIRRVPTFATGDVVVCWGESLPNTRGVRVLNGVAIRNKFTDATMLRQAGVATVEVSQRRPVNVTAREAVPATLTTTFVFQNSTKAQVRTRITELQAFLNTPDTPAIGQETWLPRRNNHIGGLDLLTPPAAPDYWSKKENLVREYRIHCFDGKSIRAGVKVGRERVRQHPWIRSYDGGWRINYDGFQSNRRMRTLAAGALEALGLQFGAVDIGEKEDGTLIALEVNRAPGLEGNTVAAYAQAIREVA